MEQVWSIIHDRLPVFVSFVVLSSAVYVVGSVLRSNTRFPLIGRELGNFEQRRKAYVSGATNLYLQGYQKFKEKVWRLTTADGERVIVPLAALDELRRYPDHVINVQKALDKLVEVDYTGTGLDPNFGIHIIRSDLTRNLPRVNGRLAAEVERTVTAEIGRCDDWTPVVMYQTLLRIVAICSGNVFVGPELCHDEVWIDSSINFTVDFFSAVRKLKEWNEWLRPLGRHFTPELRKLDEHRDRAKAFLTPVIQERRRLMEELQEEEEEIVNGEKRGEEGQEERDEAVACDQKGEKKERKGKKQLPDDMLTWMIKKAEANNFKDGDLAEVQLGLSLAAIHTTAMSVTHILYDVVLHPEIIPHLRAEVKRVLGEHGGKMTSSALFHMKLLDSVMRESARINTFNDVRFFRHVEKPITLSDGTQLPAGCDIEAAHVAIVRDPTIYPEPDRFDPWRFYRLRNGETPDPLRYHSTEQYQFVAVTKEYMNFGLGRHACPGRFFAGNEIKMVLARLFLEYDVRMPEGCTERYPNFKSGCNMMPNVEGVLEVRRVEGGDELV